MKVTHNNKTYELNVERAIELGVLKHEWEPKVGDVLEATGIKIVVIQSNGSNKYFLIGRGKSLHYFGDYPMTVEELKAKYGKWNYLGNIDKKFGQILENFN